MKMWETILKVYQNQSNLFGINNNIYEDKFVCLYEDKFVCIKKISKTAEPNMPKAEVESLDLGKGYNL